MLSPFSFEKAFRGETLTPLYLTYSNSRPLDFSVQSCRFFPMFPNRKKWYGVIL